MFRLIVPLFIAFILPLGNVFDNDVSINVTAPESVNAGQQFTVVVTLTKGTLDGFSRYLQDLPEGLTASADTNSSSEFSFEENKVRFIWIKLPSENEIKIRYIISVSENLKGEFNLGGKFSYIENNDRKTIDVSESRITIIPSPTIDPSKIVDISDFGKAVIITDNTNIDENAIVNNSVASTASSSYSGNVLCIRQRPEKSSSGSTSGYRVNILVHKGSMDKYAKIEEQIPQGYTAVSLENESGMFTFNNQSAKFLWLKVPDKSDFIVSYMLIPSNNQDANTPVMSGDLSYIVNSKSYVSRIIDRDENIKQMSTADLQKLVAQVSRELKTKSYVTSNNPKSNTIAKNKFYLPKHKESLQTYMLEPENGVYFRVQVAAGHRPINIRSYFRRLRVTEDVKSEEHEGWYKYSIGSFKDYKTARDYRIRIWNTSLVKDAFISGYNSGSRITVQEALMISNQSWLK